MTDIQRYTINGRNLILDKCGDGLVVMYSDHIKAIEAKDKEIQTLKDALSESTEMNVDYCSKNHQKSKVADYDVVPIFFAGALCTSNRSLQGVL